MGLSLAATSCATSERLIDRAGRAAEGEAGERVDRGVSAGADAAEDAVLSDGGGDGTASPGAGANNRGGSASSRPGAGQTVAVSTNNDFEAGTRTLVLDDFTGDNVGDFPRNFDLIEGSFEIVEWEGGRYLRALSGGIFAIPLPEQLPERFTIETEVSVQHGNGYIQFLSGRWFRDQRDIQ